jgi:hypothetical protein
MKTIKKEDAVIYGANWNGVYYCFEKGKNFNYQHYEPLSVINILSDVIVDDENRIHCEDDKPVIYISSFDNFYYKRWFLNGYNGRKNNEKPFFIRKGCDFYCTYFVDKKDTGGNESREVFLRDVRKEILKIKNG